MGSAADCGACRDVPFRWSWFLPRSTATGVQLIKTDWRSNSYKPTVGLSTHERQGDRRAGRWMTNGMAGEQAGRANKNVERGRATRAHLIEVATRLFAAHGYDGTSIEAVQAESGVSRGSLYHHFPGKEALFLAVLEEVGGRIGREAEEVTRDAADPVALLRAGGRLWIRNAGDPVVRQIWLIDAPAVLGWQRWREIDEEGPLGLIRDCLTYAAGTGRI